MNAFDYFFEHSGTLEKESILGPERNISYTDLYNESLLLAGYLKDQLGENKNILIAAHNSVFFIKAYLAILKSNNVAIPLSTEIEQANLDYIIGLCNPELIFTTKRMTEKINLNGVPVLHEETNDEIRTALKSKDILENKDKPNQLAEIIFTSGSTGKPKGVMISHKNLIANTHSIIDYLKLTEKDSMLVVLPFYYCYGLSLLHTHLRVGGSLVFNNMFIMLGSVINDLKKYNCTGFAGVPTHFQILLRKSDSFKTSTFPHLKYVTQAGGKLHNAFISEFIQTFPDIRFNVMYGQTEATARLAWLPPEKLPEKIGSCGKAIPGVELKVADESGNPVKPGETGEILAAGDNIMQGYYKDEESTSNTLKNGWLHTGDLATVDEEGFIFLTARKKEIIKSGGRRISPKEIEEVIVSMPEVIDCTIESVFDDVLGEAIKASVVVREKPEQPNSVTIDNIKDYCFKRLASYKIPQIIEIRHNITISPTGKKINTMRS